MRWPWEPKPEALGESDPSVESPINAEEVGEEIQKVNEVKAQLEDWRRRLEVVEHRIERPAPGTFAR